MSKPSVVASPGFTLLEIIMTLVLFGIVAVIAASYFSAGITRTDIPVKQLQTDASLQLVLENMISDQQKKFPGDLNGFNGALGTPGQVQSTYGSGSSYVVTDQRFVCPESNTFVTNTSAYQFLLVTIKPEVNSGVSLSYLFSSNSANVNCNIPGSD
ncbi:type II secretion system protein [Solidesulfovibrio sp. C21]|uniref:type II secretion system protein n=1 Tax=Solidesulfovibrio sp. C21 TaxID=3398613 RepID=UPI0039FCDF5B